MKERIKQKYKDMPIRMKITVVFIICFIAFMGLMLVVPDIFLYRSNVKKVKQNIQEECSMVNLQIDNLYENMKNCQNSTIQGINQIYSQLESEEGDVNWDVSLRNSLTSVLGYYKRSFKAVDSMVFVDTKKNIVSSGLKKIPDVKIVIELMNRIPAYGPINSIVYPVEIREEFGGDEETAILTQGIRIININTGDNLGYLFVNVKTDTVAEMFPQKAGDSYQKNYYIVDNCNRIIVSGNKEEALGRELEEELINKISQNGNGSFTANLQAGKFLVTDAQNSLYNWKIVNEVPLEDITSDIRYMVAMIIVIGLICTAVAVMMIVLLSRIITRPVYDLTKNVDRISNGDWSVTCKVESKDEVGRLSQNFNIMVRKIRNLLQQVKEEQERKRETELSLFQMQIKPHFLYNTLDLIYVCCEMDETETGGKIAKSLADYYRICLSGGQEVISIGEEIRNIENYLYIQKERYMDILKYKIEIPEECLKCRIPKLTLQPLVENAIYHGLKESDGEGMISIYGKFQADNLILTVEDDGVGMSPEHFYTLLHEETKDGKKHFGIKNVDERLRLYFGEGYGLGIDEHIANGTGIKIIIPRSEVYHD